MFGWYFEVGSWSRFWRCLIKICVRICTVQNSLNGCNLNISVVYLGCSPSFDSPRQQGQICMLREQQRCDRKQVVRETSVRFGVYRFPFSRLRILSKQIADVWFVCFCCSSFNFLSSLETLSRRFSCSQWLQRSLLSASVMRWRTRWLWGGTWPSSGDMASGQGCKRPCCRWCASSTRWTTKPASRCASTISWTPTRICCRSRHRIEKGVATGDAIMSLC